jgi:drug/metabolite transporter (DMT)-like permease
MTSGNIRTEASSAPLRGFLLILLAVTFWGGSASLAKYLILHRFDTIVITQTRSTLSFLLLAAWFAVRDRSVFRVERRDLPKLIVLGVVGIAVTNFTYYYTAAVSTVATAILVQYTAPVLVTLYAVFISREEEINGLKILSLILALIGCFFAVSGGSWSDIRLTGWAALTGPVSAVTFAFLMVYSKRILRRYSTYTMLIYILGSAAVFWLFVHPPWHYFGHGYSLSDWGTLVLFAIVSILIPHTAFTSSLRLLDASTVSIAGTLEPVIAIVVAYLALGESLTLVQSLGAVGVIFAVALLQWGTNRINKRNQRVAYANGTPTGTP